MSNTKKELIKEFKEFLKNFESGPKQPKLNKLEYSFPSQTSKSSYRSSSYSPDQKYVCDPVYDFGGEGMGDYVCIVYELYKISEPDNKVFIRVEGYYDSNDGAEWNKHFEEVEAREVTETKYFEVE